MYIIHNNNSDFLMDLRFPKLHGPLISILAILTELSQDAALLENNREVYEVGLAIERLLQRVGFGKSPVIKVAGVQELRRRRWWVKALHE